MLPKCFLLFIAAGVITPASTAAEPPVRSAGPAQSMEIERFLLRAEVVEQRPVDPNEGSYLAVLTDGRQRKTALIQTVIPYTYLWYESRDHFAYNEAAYRLDRIVGANVVSPTVLRRVNGEWASVSLSDDSGNMTRADAGERSAIFRALVADCSGSFAGGFRETKILFGIDKSVSAGERLQASLARLTRSRLKKELGDILTDRQIHFLLARSARILAQSRKVNEPAPSAGGAE